MVMKWSGFLMLLTIPPICTCPNHRPASKRLTISLDGVLHLKPQLVFFPFFIRRSTHDTSWFLCFSPWDMRFSALGICSRLNMSTKTDNWNYMKSSTDIVVSGSRKTCSTTPAIDGNDDWHHGLMAIQSHQNLKHLMGAHGSWMGFESNLRTSSLILCFCWYFL